MCLKVMTKSRDDKKKAHSRAHDLVLWQQAQLWVGVGLSGSAAHVFYGLALGSYTCAASGSEGRELRLR